MNIREILLDSQKILDGVDKGISFDLNDISSILGISVRQIKQLLEIENIVVESDTIGSNILRQLLLKEPETSSSPKNLRQLILSSEKLLIKINSKSEDIRIMALCKYLGIGFKNFQKLLKLDGINNDFAPSDKIPIATLKQIIALKPKMDSETLENKLYNLLIQIEKIDEKHYVKSVVLNQFLRSEYIREYAKIRANGVCELCDNPAPFSDKYGNPFLETHHIIYLSKGGKDTVENVAAICPNCHRKIHNLNLQTDIDKLKLKRK